MAKAIEVGVNFLKNCGTKNNFMHAVAGSRNISVSEGRVRLEFDVTEQRSNPKGTLHGGCIATAMDIATTAACITINEGRGGLSISMNIDYLNPAKTGDTIFMDAWVTKSSKNFAFTEAELYRKSDNKLVAKAVHTLAKIK